MDEIVHIINDLKKGIFKPVYFLMGEEPYYIDKLTEYIENNILTEEERGFNQMVLYGRDVTVEEIVSHAKRYPMMAEHQVIIVKEAQDLSKTIDKLDAYIDQPQPTTILVMAYKYKTLDKRKKWVKNLASVGLLFESKKLYEDKIPSWISRVLKTRNYTIEPKALAMLAAFLGNNLTKISNELDKLQIILPEGTHITAHHIEENIGFSKDFNVFELNNAIGERNELQAFTIASHFASNTKEYPMVLTTSSVFSFFSKLLQYHGLKDKSPANVAKILKVHPYFLKDYTLAMKNYPMRKVSTIVAALREMDVKSKGVGANQLPDGDLLKEMLVQVFSK